MWPKRGLKEIDWTILKERRGSVALGFNNCITHKLIATKCQQGDFLDMTNMISAIDRFRQVECRASWIYYKMNSHEYALAPIKQVQVKY